MTGPAAGAPGRGRGAPSRTGTRDAASGILIILGLGLALRLIIAYLLPGSGFKIDLNAFEYWSRNLASQGLYGFYQRPFFHDYTPGYLYVLWLVGVVGGLLNAVGVQTVGPWSFVDLMKVPPVLADLALGWLVWSMALELGASRRAARVGALLVVLNPITWFDSIVWGQVDSFGVVFLLLAIRELWRDRFERAAILTVVAAITKPQLGILVPIVAVVTIRRHLRKGAADTDDPGLEADRRVGLVARLEAATGPVRILTTGVAGLATAVVASLPFGLSLPGLVDQIFKTAGGYPYLTVNAWNPWALVSLRGRGLAENAQWVCDSLVRPTDAFQLRLGPLVLWDVPASTRSCLDAVTFGAIPAVAVGALLLIVALVVVAAVVAARPDRRTILVGVAVLSLAFFVLPTRVHERYLFPLVAVGAILAAVSVRWRVAYAVSSAATLANMYVVLTTLYPGNPHIADWLGVGRMLMSYPGVAIAAITQLVVLAWAATELRRGAIARLGRDIESTRAQELERESELEFGDVVEVRVPAADLPTPRTTVPSGLEDASGGADATIPAWTAMSGADEAGAQPPPILEPRWYERPSYAAAGLRGWLAARLWDRPVRPDRTAALEGEGGGRIDRLDVWIVVVLVASLLTIRMWRLAEPYQMHFDEVYHPRTAAEFLQDWRYGLSHDIYEWTHPHLAKYAMALGIEAFGDDRTSATSNLGVPVAGAAIERRWDDGLQGGRLGDRVWVATGTTVRAYDATTRNLVADLPVDGAAAIAVDQVLHRAYVGTSSGDILMIDTRPLDNVRNGAESSARALVFTRLEGPVTSLFLPRDATSLVAVLGQGSGGAATPVPSGPSSRVVTIDTSTASELGVAQVQGVTQIADAGTGRVAVAGAGGVSFVDLRTGSLTLTLPLGGPVMGVAQTRDLGDDRLYVSYLPTGGPRVAQITGVDGKPNSKPAVGTTFRLPGASAGWVGYDNASMMVHVLGDRPAAGQGAAGAGTESTIYVIEPHADAVYEDATVPFSPTAIVLDDDQRYPSSDRQQILAFSAQGGVGAVEVGKHAFAWRVPGVLAGVAMAALLYLLTRLLFRRREVAVALAFLTVVDGMLFVQSRIGMNDSYVGLGIVAAYTLFAWIWLRPGDGRRHWIAFALAMPVIGVLLGLALAAKWVAAYAIGALGILVLARSALGRLVLIAGLIGLTTVLGYMAISVPNGVGANYLFLAIMVALTLAAAVANVLHPIGWTWEEQRLATFAPGVAGLVILLAGLSTGQLSRSLALGPARATPLELGFAAVIASLAIHALFVFAGRRGFGPMAAPPRPDDPVALLDPPASAPAGWLRLGAGFGLPALWTLFCLVAIPLVVYVVSYLPWAAIEGHRLWEPGQLFGLAKTSWPPGHTGQTLWDLTQQMYRYHNTLSAPHAASSPWWAWIFDFKPVWFYQESFAGGTTAAIYDSGNLVAWWIGIPAVAFAAWAAFRRRSIALALVTVGFACQWVAWARIDRAAFQYHYYTSLPFLFIALAYFLAELWNGASRRLWLVARLAAAAAVLAPTALWLFHRPLCGFVRVTDVNPGSRACPTLVPEFVLTSRAAGIAIVLGVGLLVLLRLLLDVDEDRIAGRRAVGRGRLSGALAPLGPFGPAAAAALGVTLAYLVATRLLSNEPLLTLTNVPVEPVALLVTVALVPVAAFVATARDARRFVVGLLVTMGFWFVLWYPNIAALPLPTALSNAYQGLLPTYVYPFQFPVSTVNRNVAGPPLVSLGSVALLASLTVVVVIVAYSVWVARLADAERRAGVAADAAGGDWPGGPGAGGGDGAGGESPGMPPGRDGLTGPIRGGSPAGG